MADIATAEVDGRTVAVRVDGEWCPLVYHYTEDLPVFTLEGSEIDVRQDGTILYETPGGAVQEIEPYLDEGGVASYLPMRIYPADNIEVHDISESEAADFSNDAEPRMEGDR